MLLPLLGVVLLPGPLPSLAPSQVTHISSAATGEVRHGVVREGEWTAPLPTDQGLRWQPFPDVELELELRSVRAGQRSGRIYEFSVRGEPEGWGRWVVERDAFVADVVSPSQGAYSARWGSQGGAPVVRQINRSLQATCAGALAASRRGLAPGRGLVPGPRTQAAASGWTIAGTTTATDVAPNPIIDILVMHTPGVRQVAGGASAVDTIAESYVAYTNAVYAGSGVRQRIRLVGVEETMYDESLNVLTDLVRLKRQNDGFMDEVHPLRDAVAADCVVLLVDAGGAGVAYLMDDVSPSFENFAFGVVRYDAGGIPFAHELGHIMGAGHNNGSAVPDAAYCDSYGHRTPDNQWRTLMSSPPGQFVDRFSNPNLIFAGWPLGVSGAGCPDDGADCVRTFNATASVVAGFR